jgi:hypothetical protein
MTLSEDKSTYNKINAKLKISPPEIKARYHQLKSKVGTEEFDDFVEKLLSTKGREFSEEFIQECKTIEDIKETGTESHWLSWKEALAKEDEDILVSALKSNPPLLESRSNPRVPQGSSVPWPRNLEVKWVREGSKQLARTTDTSKDVGAMDSDPDSREAFAKKFKLGHVVEGPAVTPHVALSVQSAGVDPRIKDTCSHLRKAHSAWDRCRRDIEAVVSRSKANANTSGSKVEKDALAIVAVGEELDSKVQAMGRAYLTTNTLTEDQIDEAALLCQGVKDKIKEASKKSSALKAWFAA